MSIMFLLMITVKPTNSTSVVFPTSNAFKIKALAMIINWNLTGLVLEELQLN